jgi:hypothetical protein
MNQASLLKYTFCKVPHQIIQVCRLWILCRKEELTLKDPWLDVCSAVLLKPLKARFIQSLFPESQEQKQY